MDQLISMFTWVAGASIKTLPLILLTLLLQRYGKRLINASGLHILWMFVLLSLSLPIGWSIHAFDGFALQNTEQIYQPDEIVVPAPEAKVNRTDNVASGVLIPQNASAHNPFSQQTTLNFPLILSFVWLAGISLCLFAIAYQYWRFYRIKSRAIIASEQYRTLLEKLKSRIDLRQNVSLLISDRVDSPVTFGYLRPAILLPQTILEDMHTNGIEHIFLHELTHIKRRDIAFCWLASLITILHWFNPAAWFALSQMRKNLEIACDAEALTHLQVTQHADYGKTLISLADKSRRSQHARLAVGILENHTDLKERITMITQIHKNGLKSRLLILFLASLFAFTAIAQPTSGTESEKQVAGNNPNAVELGAFVRKAEKDLKETILVGESYANDKIRVSRDLGKLDYGKLLSVLKVNDFTAFRTTNLIKVIPAKDARNSAIPVVEADGKYYEDEYVTDYISLVNACAPKILPVLRPMIPMHSHLASNHAHSLIVTDTYGNIQRIKKVIERIESGLNKPEECDFSNS